MDQNHDHSIQIAPSEPDELSNEFCDKTDEAGFHAAAEILRLFREIEGKNSHILNTWIWNWLLGQKCWLWPKMVKNNFENICEWRKDDKTKIEREAAEDNIGEFMAAIEDIIFELEIMTTPSDLSWLDFQF